MNWTHIGNSNYEARNDRQHAMVNSTPDGSWDAWVQVETDVLRVTASSTAVGFDSLKLAQIWATAACLQLQRIAERLGEVEQ